MPKSLITRILHTALTIAILHQLVVSWFMEPPKPSGAVANLGFEFHEAVGLASLGLLLLFWLWAMIRRTEQSLADLVPWFSKERRLAVFRDIRTHGTSLAKLRLPVPTGETPLASAVHGLGLCLATAMAVTGAIVYGTMGPDGSLAALGGGALTLHGALANLMWAYLIGHAGVAIAHDLAGHRSTRRMFLGQD